MLVERKRLPMKLCIVTHSVTLGDGQGRVNYEIAQEALNRGHQVILIASRVAPELEQRPSVRWVPIRVSQFPGALLRNLAFSYRSARWLNQHRHDYDVVLSNGAITSAPSDVNTAHFVHSTWLTSPYHTIRYRPDPYGAYQWLYTALNAYWERQAFKRSTTVIAVSGQVKDELMGIGLPHGKIQVILNGVDLEEFQPCAVDRVALGLPQDVFLGLFAGDIRTPRKNLGTVLRSLVNLPKVHLAIAGDTKGSPYPAMAKDLGIQDRTHFLGYRRDMPQLMQAVDSFIFPSRYETFGLVILEAMASGIPVITTATTGASELITPEVGYVISHPENVTEIEHALRQLSQDPDLCQRQGAAARKTAQQYTWQRLAQQYLSQLESLALSDASNPSIPAVLS